MIEAAEADEFIRAAVLAVLTTLTATGRIAREETEAYVLEAVSGAVRQAFGRGLTDPMVIGDIRTDLGRTLANPELSGWSTLSDAAKRDQERHAIGRQDAHRTFPDTPQSFVAPLKTIGPESILPVWQWQKVQEVLPPVRISPALSTDPIVRPPRRTSTINIFQIQALLVTLTFYTTKTLTRRGIVAGVASVALIRRVCASTTDVDIVVVGAGAAGLAAAKQIKAAGQSVIVLEARSRIGGRAFTDTSLGAPFDAGAEFIHWAERNPMKRHADEWGVPLKDDDTGGGRFMVLRDGQPLSEAERARRRSGFNEVDRYITPMGGADKSFAEAVRGAPDGVAEAAAGITRMALGEEPDRVSIQDYDQLWSGDDYVVPSGYGALVTRLRRGRAGPPRHAGDAYPLGQRGRGGRNAAGGAPGQGGDRDRAGRCL